VETKDGVITERENVELPASEEEKEVEEMESIAGGDMGDDEEVSTEESANPIPEDTDMASMVTKLQYRIEELEKKMQSMETIKEGGDAEKVKTEDLPGDPTKVNTVEKMAAVEPDEEDEEDELPKLDGAPIDENAPNKTGIKMNKKGALINPQNSFLSKLYK
jgi:hypothetical protein